MVGPRTVDILQTFVLPFDKTGEAIYSTNTSYKGPSCYDSQETFVGMRTGQITKHSANSG